MSPGGSLRASVLLERCVIDKNFSGNWTATNLENNFIKSADYVLARARYT